MLKLFFKKTTQSAFAIHQINSGVTFLQYRHVCFYVILYKIDYNYVCSLEQSIFLPFRLAFQDADSLTIRRWTHRRVVHQLETKLTTRVVVTTVTQPAVFAQIGDVIQAGGINGRWLHHKVGCLRWDWRDFVGPMMCFGTLCMQRWCCFCRLAGFFATTCFTVFQVPSWMSSLSSWN